MTGDVDKQVAELSVLLEERLRVRARTPEAQLRKAGRLVPNRVRADIRTVLQAQTMSTHPKLRLMVNAVAVGKAHDRAVQWLRSVDPKERRKDWWLSMAGSVAFSVLAVSGLLIAVLVWRDLI